MKLRLNNKGVTLIELIVSFALVAVAIIYFYQTLYTVSKLYGESQKETNEYVMVNYVYRIIDALNNNEDATTSLTEKIGNYMDQDKYFGDALGNKEGNLSCVDNWCHLEFEILGKSHSFYYYNS